MATEVLDIVVRESGSQQAERSIRRVGTTAKGTSSSLKLLAAAATALASALSIKAFAAYADSLTIIRNRLKLVTDSTKQLNAVQLELFAIANRSGTEVGAVADVYARVARSAEQLRLTDQRLLKISEALNQSFIVAGATAQEVAAASVQLGQGLASGRLQGDELRSILEANPILAKAIAKEFNTTIGALRDLGAAGELTTQRIISAIERMAGPVGEEFRQMEKTIAQTLQIAKNNFLQLVGQFDAATGASKGLKTAITAISNALPNIAAAGLSAFNSLRAAAEQAASIFTQDLQGGAKQFLDFLPLLGEQGGSVFTFISDSLLQIVPNIRTVVRIALAEFDVLLAGARSIGADIVATIFQALANVPLLGEFFKADEAVDSLIEIKAEFERQKAVRREVANDFIQQTLREREASRAQFEERTRQLAELQAAAIKAAGLPTLPPPPALGGANASGSTATAPGLGQGLQGASVTREDVSRAIKSGELRGQDSFGKPFGPPVVQSQPIVIEFSNGQKSEVFGDPDNISVLIQGLEDEARKAGVR